MGSLWVNMSRFALDRKFVVVLAILLNLLTYSMARAQDSVRVKEAVPALEVTVLKLSEYYDAVVATKGASQKVYMFNNKMDLAAVVRIMQEKGNVPAIQLFEKGTWMYKPVMNKIVGVAFGVSLVEFAVGALIYNSNNSVGEVFLIGGITTMSVALPVGLFYGIRSGIGHRKIVKSLDLYNEGLK